MLTALREDCEFLGVLARTNEGACYMKDIAVAKGTDAAHAFAVRNASLMGMRASVLDVSHKP